MIKILCPTDFSEHAKKAMDFAFNLAKIMDAEIHLITTFKEQRHASSFKSVARYIKENFLRDLKRVSKELKEIHRYENEVHLSAIEGYASDIINSYANSVKIDLIVLGTQGNNVLSNRIFGSVTSKVVRNAKVPVLAVPFNSMYSFSRGNFLFPIDNKAIYQNHGFNVINTFCEKLEKKVDILHINRSNEDKAFPFDPYISEYLENHIDQIVIEDSDDPSAFIHDYVNNHPTEMLIMLRREHSLIEQTFYLSNTDKELKKTHVPLLIIPDV